jgi:ADP-ribose pyrophosphatase
MGGEGPRTLSRPKAPDPTRIRWKDPAAAAALSCPPEFESMVAPWKKLDSRPLGDFRIFRLRQDRLVSPRTGKEHDFFVLDAVDWVNVIAVTPDGQLVCVEQYRHGTETIELEIPGGVMDPRDASPVETAIRELREETGYAGEGARLIGQVASNPAILSNTCYTVLIEQCRLTHDVEFDHGEDLATRLVSIPEMTEAVRQGRVRHSLVVAALYHFHLLSTGVRPEK